MAALDTPWIASMSPSSTYNSDNGTSSPRPSYDPNPPTNAAFSPTTFSRPPLASKQRSTIIVHKKSPLLVATPPQITRALAYSHPFLLPLNRLAGLLSWSTDDPWESFLLVAGFWATSLYGSDLIRWAGPIIVVVGLILGMYSRRYSPLSSTSQTGEKHGHKRDPSEGSSRHHKSLDEIVETLREFTGRCNLLLDPFLSLTDFLSTQRTATSATTRPALTTLFIRILLVTPLWIILTLPPFYILTARRVILTFGTLTLTWHSRPARVSRVILWRSLTVRRFCALITGLSFSHESDPAKAQTSKLPPPALPPRRKSQATVASDLATKRRPESSGVRFTFILYENQRRWIGLGWTTSLFAYERGPWTDEHLNPAPSVEEFELPEVEGGHARWRWVDGSKWRVEGASKDEAASPSKVGSGGDGKENGGGGWIYYDSKWNDGRRDTDGWGRYTRRRKWWRDAELVEATPSTEITPSHTPSHTPSTKNNPDKAVQSDNESNERKESGVRPRAGMRQSDSGIDGPSAGELDGTMVGEDNDASSVKAKKKGWFGGAKEKEVVRKRSGSKSSSGKKSRVSVRSEEGPEHDHLDRWRSQQRDDGRGAYGLAEDAAMGLS